MLGSFSDMLSMGFCKTRHWKTSGRLVQELNVSTVKMCYLYTRISEDPTEIIGTLSDSYISFFLIQKTPFVSFTQYSNQPSASTSIL